VSQNSKCVDCESYLEFFLSIKNNTDSDLYVRQYEKTDSLKKGAIRIVNSGVSYDAQHEIVDSLLIKAGTSFNLVVQPDIYVVQMKDTTRSKYDNFLKRMAEKAEIVYHQNGSKIQFVKSSKFKVTDRLH
jgi:hypothetical protein